MFRNENAPIASKIPYHNIEQWKKAIGDRLRYSGTELRKSIDQAGIGSLRCRLCRSWLVQIPIRFSQSVEKDNWGVCGRETVFRRARRCGGPRYSRLHFSGELTNRQAMRQATFTDKIHQLGWLEPEFFESPESAQVVQQSILRYYGSVVFPTIPLFSFFLGSLTREGSLL